MFIEFDPKKDARNMANHDGLSLALAEEFTEAARVYPTYRGSDPVRYKMIELTRHGLLTAIVTPRGPKMRVISLRRASKKESRMYAEEVR